MPCKRAVIFKADQVIKVLIDWWKEILAGLLKSDLKDSTATNSNSELWFCLLNS